MNRYILLPHIEVQNANAVAGFTWGFPSITHFLGFVHQLHRKMKEQTNFSDIRMEGCAVVSHKQQVHTYQSSSVGFTQSRNPPYLSSHNKESPPPIIEEGKMNMEVSLLIAYTGSIGNRRDALVSWLKEQCFLHRLAGGTIWQIKEPELFTLTDTDDGKKDLSRLRRCLLPGFVLMDRSNLLADHLSELKQTNPNAQTLDAWLKFTALNQKARPESDLIERHFDSLNTLHDAELTTACIAWQEHLKQSYDADKIPQAIKTYFSNLKIKNEKSNAKLLVQWESYLAPSEKTNAIWEYQPKPNPGYLVPIMTGYKAITKVFSNNEVDNTRDNTTDVCFVEAAHTVGEWRSIHRLSQPTDVSNTIWRYNYEENWYLCTQSAIQDDKENPSMPSDIFGDSVDELNF